VEFDMSFPRCLAIGLALVLASACQTEVFGGKDTFSPAVQQRDWAQERIDAARRGSGHSGPDQRDPAAQAVAELAAALYASERAPRSVLCLPLVSRDLRRGRPWVALLGVEVADSVARALADRGFAGEILETADAGLRIDRANLSRSGLTTAADVAAQAERLGVDAVVFGSLERRDMAGALDRSVIAGEITAYDVAGRRALARVRFEMPSDDLTLRRAWELAQAESSWMPDSAYGLPQRTPALAAELERAAETIAAALAPSVEAGQSAGAWYVAPLDVQAFAPEIAALRAAQGAYASEVARRAADGAGRAGPVVLHGTEFPDLQSAEAWVLELAAQFEASPAARFAAAFSSTLLDALRARLQPAGRAVTDLAAASPVDRALVAGELAQGGLARSSAALEALRAAGVGVVVAPRLERVGDALSIRADAYDLARAANAAGGRAEIPASLRAELERALAAGPRGAPADAAPGGPSKPAPARPRPGGSADAAPGATAWTGVYERTKSGVVHVLNVDGDSRGSGFLVDARGLVLTNEHVVRGAGALLQVMPANGTPLRARTVASDPHWDLALLAVEGLPRDAHVFEFAEGVAVGAEVAVLGHPRDSSGWVLTPGFVSSVTERIDTSDGQEREAWMYTSPTRAGSSGSPVLLADGRVAAVHSAGAVGQSLTDSSARTELTGFALGIPAREARRFVESAPRP
jgi:S1-C subfamily serine protease